MPSPLAAEQPSVVTSEIAGPKFNIVTKALSGGVDDAGKRRFRATASSTITDLAGDEITLPALEKMAQKFRQGVTIFMDHDFQHVDSAFGLTDGAEILQRGVDKAGTPVWDLDISGVVNTPSPRATQLADSIDGGFVKLGASVTAFVRSHSRKKQGGMLISDMDVIEASIVGVPENQRSWAQKAALAIKSFNFNAKPVDEETSVSDEQEETLIVSKGDLSASARNNLSDSDFACPEQRKYPINDAAHVRAALSRIADPTNDQCGRDKIIAAARKMGIGEHASKSLDDAGLVSWALSAFPASDITIGEDGEEVFIITKSIDTEPTVEETENQGDPAGEESPADSTTGVQESAEETPETTPSGDETETDAPELEKVASFAPEDVAELVKQTGLLAAEIGRLREENSGLKAQVDAQAQANEAVSKEVDLATQVIGEVMKLPLRSKTAGFVGDFTSTHKLFDPDIADYLDKRERTKIT